MEGFSNSRCINCTLLLPRPNQGHEAHELSAPLLNVLTAWITPTEVIPSSKLCNECHAIIREEIRINGANLPEPRFGHRDVCFACGCSVLRARTCRVPLASPEREVILKWTPRHQAPRLEKVCRACWQAATREVRRQELYDAHRPLLDHNIQDNVPENNLRIPDPPPLPPSPPHRLHNIPPPPAPVPKIASTTYRRAASTANRCLFADCREPERLLVPSLIKDMLLLRQRLYVPPSARICQHHLITGNWDELVSDLNDFTAVQFDHMMGMMERAARYRFDFGNIDKMPLQLCYYWFGLSPEQFYELLACAPTLSAEPNGSIALSVYLIKLRTGDSNERLSSLFQMVRSTFERHMNMARDCLTTDFVPNYLGFDHMTVENVASRNRIIPEAFFGDAILPEDVKPAIAICDATYTRCNTRNPNNFKRK